MKTNFRHVQHLINAPENVRLVYLLYGYLVLWLLFGGIYYFLYKQDRNSFVFNEDILNTKIEVFRQISETRLAELNAKLTKLEERKAEQEKWEAEQEKRLKEIETKPILILNGRDGKKIPIYLSDLEESEGTEGVVRFIYSDVFKTRIKMPTYIITSDYDIGMEILETKAEIGSINKRKATLADEVPHVWEPADFLYFSMITQTTLGFGDIMPNRTLVRALVTVQLFISVLLVAFGINVVIKKRRN